jgi:hypothetical protein
LFDRLVFELEGVFRSLHLLFSISVLTSYFSTDLGEYQDEYENLNADIESLHAEATYSAGTGVILRVGG